MPSNKSVLVDEENSMTNREICWSCQLPGIALSGQINKSGGGFVCSAIALSRVNWSKILGVNCGSNFSRCGIAACTAATRSGWGKTIDFGSPPTGQANTG